MTESVKATRASVQLGYLEIDGFMLPDGSYRMSLTQAGECVSKPAQGVSNFLNSKTLKRLLGETGGVSNFLPEGAVEVLSGEAYIPDIFVVDIEDGGGQTRIRGLPLEVVSLYWQWESFRGNKQAFILSTALVIESLERRFDNAFEVVRSEIERNLALTERVRRLERDISEAFWVDDEIRMERDHYERLLRENGIDPWRLPEAGDEPG